MSVQSMKAALQSRVVPSQSTRLSSQRQNLGEGLTCPAGAANIHNDIYGRAVTQNTLDLRDSACSNYTISAPVYMQYETNNRPTIAICAAGLRGASDMMGVGRDSIGLNLYNTGANPYLPGTEGEGDFRGQFGPKLFGTANDATPQTAWPPEKIQPYDKPVQAWDLTMNSASTAQIR